jgi:hypothetical protein
MSLEEDLFREETVSTHESTRLGNIALGDFDLPGAAILCKNVGVIRSCINRRCVLNAVPVFNVMWCSGTSALIKSPIFEERSKSLRCSRSCVSRKSDRIRSGLLSGLRKICTKGALRDFIVDTAKPQELACLFWEELFRRKLFQKEIIMLYSF